MTRRKKTRKQGNTANGAKTLLLVADVTHRRMMGRLAGNIMSLAHDLVVEKGDQFCKSQEKEDKVG